MQEMTMTKREIILSVLERGILRLRRAARFALRSASLRMTGLGFVSSAGQPGAAVPHASIPTAKGEPRGNDPWQK